MSRRYEIKPFKICITAIYLQQLQRCISDLFLVKRAAHQLEVELEYLQRKNITSINEANRSSNVIIKYSDFMFEI